MAKHSRAAATALMLAVSAAWAIAQAPQDTEIQGAIAAGLRGDPGERMGCRAGGGFGSLKGFDMLLVGPLNRIQRAASDAKKKYLPFTIEQVTADMRADTVQLIATPQVPEYNNVGHFWDEAAPATHAVIKSRPKNNGTPVVIQPVSHELVPVEWSNMMGGKRTGQGITATFSLSDFRNLPAGDVELAVITEKNEKNCKVSASDRQKVR
jgi:hypothetical protein